MTLQPEKILVVDDDIQIRRVLHNVLSERGYDVLLASNGEEALALTSLSFPSMIILDMAMPGISGVDLCREIRKCSSVPILILSVINREDDKISALEEGADDYLTKPFGMEELLARIRAHMRRANNINKVPSAVTMFESRGLKIDTLKHQVFRNGEEIKLTKTELSLLEYFIQNSDRIITYSMLLDNFSESKGDIRTFRVHIGKLRKKIEHDSSRPDFIFTEPGIGYRFVADK